MVDVYLQAKRDGDAAKRFFRRLLRSHGGESRKIVTDKLRSYGIAHRELLSEKIHSTKRYENHRAEQSHQAIQISRTGAAIRLCACCGFKSLEPRQALDQSPIFSGSQG